MAIVACQICSKKFYVKPSHQKLGYGKFCSRVCQSQAQRKGAFVECHLCAKQVWRMPVMLSRSKSGYYFCSKSCSLTWKNRDIFSGEHHPLWNGGESVYRQIMLRSDKKQICNLCGLVDKRVLAVHHIDHNRKNNDLSNLRWLCMNCHVITHLEDRKLYGDYGETVSQ